MIEQQTGSVDMPNELNEQPATGTGAGGGKEQASAELQKILADLKDGGDQATRQSLINDLLAASFERQIELSLTEAGLVYTIIQALVSEVGKTIRTKIAEHLSLRDDVPNDLIMSLAEDEIEIALPVLTQSDLLNDQDLLRLVVDKTREHQVAITKRNQISPVVSEALASTSDTEVISSLLKNERAELAPSTMDHIAGMCRDVAEIREPFVARHDLPPAHAAKLHVWVSDSLREQLVDRFQFEPSILEAAISEAFLETMAEAAHQGADAGQQQEAASEKELEQAGNTLLGFLRSGVKRRFERQFGHMVDLSPGATRRMLYGMGMEGLAVACNYIGFKEQVFSRLLWHLHGSGTLAMFRMNPKHKEAMDYYQSIDSGQAATLIHSLRTAPPD